MGLWYQDVLKGIGLTAVGATSAAATGGGQLGTLAGGAYGAIKAGMGGIDNFGTSWYQVAAPAAAGGLALYPSAKAADVRLNAPGGIAGDPSRLSVQTAYLGSEISSLFGKTGDGASSFVNSGAQSARDSIAAGGSWLGELVKGTGKGLTDFVNKGGLVPLLGGLKVPSFATPNIPTPGQLFPGVTTILGTGAQPPAVGGTVGIPIPSNNSSVTAAPGGMSLWLIAAAAILSYFIFVKKGKLA